MSAVDMFRAAPPISRTLAASAFTLSILGYSGIINLGHAIFLPNKLVALPPQLWRLVTSFLITGKDLGIIFDTYFLYNYGSKLETASPRFSQPGDFFTYILFVCATILGLNYFVTGGYVFTAALVLAFTYTSCQDDRGQKATFFIVTVPAQWIPYLMLLMTFITQGPYGAKVQGSGLIAAHLYDFLTRLWPQFGGGRNLVPTPAFISRLWQTTQPTVTARNYGTAHAPAQRVAVKSSGSVLPEAWKSRGSGHRLGGD